MLLYKQLSIKSGVIAALALLFCFVKSISAVAQEQYTFRHMNTSDGLSCGSVISLFVDSRGYLWIGTESGLNRYDGYSIQSYYAFDQGSINLANNIQSIQEDAEGKIWIESPLPYTIYKGGKDGFVTDVANYLKSLGIDVEPDYKVHADPQKNIYVLTSGKIYYYNFHEKRLQSWPVSLSFRNPSTWHVDDLQEGIVIAHENEIWKFDNNKGRLQKLAMPESVLGPYARLNCYVDRENTIWVYSTMNEDIFHLRADGTVLHPIKLDSSGSDSHSNSIRSVIDDEMGHIWIATDHKGVFIYTKHTGEVTNIVSKQNAWGSLASNNVTCLYKDHMGTIWMGHMKNGISYTNDHYMLFQSKAQSCGDISTMFSDKQGNIWLGTDGDGLFVEHKDGTITKANIPNITISSVTEEKNGDILVGTYNDGIYRLAQGGTAVAHWNISSGSLPNNSAWRIVEDNYDKIWICSAFSTLASYDIKTGAYKEYRKDDGSDILGLSLYYDSKKTLYVGTFYGVWSLDVTTGKGKPLLGNKSGNQDFLHTTISSIMMDDKHDALWLGHMSGLSIWDFATDSIHYINTKNGLADNSIRNIIQDELGNVWLSTGRGISCIQTSWNDGFRAVVRNYTTHDGLRDSYFNMASATLTPDKKIAMGGPNGYTLINYAEIIGRANSIPAPIISQICVGDSVVVSDPLFVRSEEGSEDNVRTIVFQPEDHQITIRFFTGNLLNAQRVRYAYRIVGNNDAWMYTNEGYVSFYSLPSGIYTFEVKACGEDGVWSDVTSIEIIIEIPFYASVWAIMLYILVAVSLIGFLLYYARKTHQQKLVMQKAERDNEQFEKMSQMKSQFFTNISNELRTPLCLVISPLQALVNEPLPNETKQRLQIILKNAQYLLHQVNMLLDFRHSDNSITKKMNLQSDNIVSYLNMIYNSFLDYAQDRKTQFIFTAQNDTVVLPYDNEKIYRVMYNLVSNALRFTPANGVVKINVRDDDKYLYVDIADNGPSIPDTEKALVFRPYSQPMSERTKQSGGLSLQIVNEYVKQHGGEMSISDNKPNGVVFTFSLPRPAKQVVYVPFEKKSADSTPEGNAIEISNNEMLNTSSSEQNIIVDNVSTIDVVPEENVTDSPALDPKEEFLAQALQEADEKRQSEEMEQKTIAAVVASVTGAVDDSNAADAADRAFESMQAELDGEKNHRFTMLMVDDAPDMCRFARDYFRGEYNVITAGDGEQALQKLRENEDIDLVVSDVTMPRMDGFELCQAIKTDLRWSHIPVILLTGRTGEEVELQGLKLGADDYITKPFNAETLRLRVKKFIEMKAERQREFKEQVDVSPSAITITSIDQQFIQKAIKIVEDHIADTEFSVEVLGREMAMSRTYLYKKLMNITGKGPAEFIRIIRLKRGKQMLDQSQMQITEIAYTLGYNSPKRFSENFKAEFGMSPSEYVKKMKAEKEAAQK